MDNDGDLIAVPRPVAIQFAGVRAELLELLGEDPAPPCGALEAWLREHCRAELLRRRARPDLPPRAPRLLPFLSDDDLVEAAGFLTRARRAAEAELPPEIRDAMIAFMNPLVAWVYAEAGAERKTGQAN